MKNKVFHFISFVFPISNTDGMNNNNNDEKKKMLKLSVKHNVINALTWIKQK